MLINTHGAATPPQNTHEAQELRIAARKLAARLEALRQRIRASLDGMDETPANPGAWHAAERRNADLWRQIEQRPAGQRQKQKGDVEIHGNRKPTTASNKNPAPQGRERDRGVVAILRDMVTFKKTDQGIRAIYNDGESENLDAAIAFLAPILSAELSRPVPPHEIRNYAKQRSATDNHKAIVTG